MMQHLWMYPAPHLCTSPGRLGQARPGCMYARYYQEQQQQQQGNSLHTHSSEAKAPTPFLRRAALNLPTP
jgi:hypothetical protein